MKKLTIKWQRLIYDGQTCPRCGSTGEEVEKALISLKQSLDSLGISVALEKSELTIEQFKQDTLQSNAILLNERPLEEWINGTSGQSQCCDVCGPNDCRTLTVDNEVYEVIPAELVIKAGLLAAAQLLAPESNTCDERKGERAMKIEIYDPAMCCSTGICGPSVDPELVRMQEVLRQIQKQAPEMTVARFGLASEPQAFVDNAEVSGLLKSEGPECLPLVFVCGELVSKGAYPGNEQLQELLKRAGINVTLGEKKKVSCSCGPGCC